MIDKIRLDRTCFACPEQYNAFINDKQVGYLRVRHGLFRVNYKDQDGELLFFTNINGDGMFTEEEREHHLNHAKEVILNRYLEDKGEKNGLSY